MSGEMTKLKEGCVIGFYRNNQSIVVNPSLESDSKLKWPNGDDKKIAGFIRDYIDFANFVEIIAEMLGLKKGMAIELTDGIAFHLVK